MSKVTVGLKLAGDLELELNGKKQVVNGHAKNLIQVVDGHGLTEVDKDFWEAWHQANKETKLVKSGFIFAQATREKAKAEAKEKRANKSGTEKLKQGEGVETAEKVG